MSFTCEDLDAALRDETDEGLAQASSHARTCADCRERLAAWDEVSSAATALRKSWDSPDLWPRIQQDLARESPARTASSPRFHLASRLLPIAATVLVAAAWLLLRGFEGGRLPGADPERRLLTERALGAVERSEQEYIASIDRLAALVDPLLQKPASPLLLSYREKLQILDAAIAECRAQIEGNRYNAHLRKELLSIYREKQRTLEQVVEQERHAL